MEPSDAVIRDEENTAALRDLVRQLRSPIGIVPFVGAGMSVPLGMPGWSDLLRQTATSVGIDASVAGHLEAGRFEQAAQTVEEAAGERAFHDLIRDKFGEHRLTEEGLLAAPVALVPRIATGPVVTTNFDRVLERVFKTAQRPFDTVVKGAELDSIGEALDLNLHALLKVHGDVGDRTQRTLTLREYESRYAATGDAPHLGKQLELLCLRARFLFLGCSLEQDRLMTVLRDLNKRYPSIVHYALLQRPASTSAFAARIKLLSECGIRPIWYPEQQFGNIRAFLQFLAEQRASASGARLGEEIADRERSLLRDSSTLLAGREPALDALDRYAASTEPVVQIVTGNPGMGKSAALAHWIVNRAAGQGTVAFHFFSERRGLTSVRDAYLHLLYQLSDATPPLSDELAGASEEKLRQELYHQLQAVPSQRNGTVTLVLDGLDEAERPFRPFFKTPLSDHIRVVVSARAGAPEYLEGWRDAASVLRLESLTTEGVTTWLRRVRNGVLRDYAADAGRVRTLWERTEGFPLFLNFVIDDLLATLGAGAKADALSDSAPGGFSEYVRERLGRLAKDEAGLPGDARTVFALLAASYGTLSLDDLEALAGVTALDLPRIPSRVTRWFDIRTQKDGTITWAFGHPQLGREFVKALGGPARKAEKDLIGYCERWPEHGSRYALEFLADHLDRADRYEELLTLARDPAYYARQRLVSRDNPQAPLRTIRTALAAAASRNEARTMAECVVLQAMRIEELQLESPLDALGAGSLSRAWQLADVHQPERAILWHMLVAVELLERGERELALKTLLNLENRNLDALSGWSAVAAAGLQLRLADVSEDAVARLSRQLIPGYGQTVETVSALHRLALQLVERGHHDLAIRVDRPRRDIVRAAVVNARIRRGDTVGAEQITGQITDARIRAQAKAELAVHLTKTGAAPRGLELLNSAVQGVRGARRGQAEVALQLARVGRLDEALDLIDDVEDAQVYAARTLREIALVVHEWGEDPGQVFDRLVTLAEATEKEWRPEVVAEQAIAYLKTAAIAKATAIVGKLLAEAARGDRASIRAVATVAAAYAELGDGELAQKLFGLAREHARVLRERADETLSDVARRETDAGMFASAELTLALISPNWRSYGASHLAIARASAGALTQVLTTLDEASGSYQQVLAEIASALLATGEWRKARDVLVLLLQSGDQQAPWHQSTHDEALTRIAVVLARTGRSAQARDTIDRVMTGRASALSDLAAAMAEVGEGAAALEITKAIPDDDSYEKERALLRVGVEQARRGEAVSAITDLETLGSYRQPWLGAVDLMRLLHQLNITALVKEFRLYQGEFQSEWWSDRTHIDAIRSAALALAGDVDAALALTRELSDRRIIASFERIAAAAAQQGREADVVAAAHALPQVRNTVLALVGIAMSQFRAGRNSDGVETLSAALARVSRIEETHERQDALIEAGVAHLVGGDAVEAERLWDRARQLESRHYSSPRMSHIAPLQADDISRHIVRGLAAAGLPQATEWIPRIEDIHARAGILSRIASGHTPGGEFTRLVLDVAQGLVLGRDDWLSEMIDALVVIRDVEAVKSLISDAAESTDGAMRACAALAELYPEQAGAIAEFVVERLPKER